MGVPLLVLFLSLFQVQGLRPKDAYELEAAQLTGDSHSFASQPEALVAVSKLSLPDCKSDVRYLTTRVTHEKISGLFVDFESYAAPDSWSEIQEAVEVVVHYLRAKRVDHYVDAVFFRDILGDIVRHAAEFQAGMKAILDLTPDILQEMGQTWDAAVLDVFMLNWDKYMNPGNRTTAPEHSSDEGVRRTVEGGKLLESMDDLTAQPGMEDGETYIKAFGKLAKTVPKKMFASYFQQHPRQRQKEDWHGRISHFANVGALLEAIHNLLHNNRALNSGTAKSLCTDCIADELHHRYFEKARLDADEFLVNLFPPGPYVP